MTLGEGETIRDPQLRIQYTRRAVGGLVALVAALATAAAFGALPSKSTETVTVGKFVQVGIDAACPAGKAAVAGGFDAALDPAQAGGVPYLKASRRSSAGWHGEVRNFGAANDYTVIAYCSSRYEVRTRDKAVTVPGNGSANATARCRRSQRVIAGGVATSDQDLAPQRSTRAGKRGWRATFSSDTGVDRTATVFAYCVRKRHAPTLVARSKQVPVGSLDARTARVRCPRGRVAFSGGFDAQPGARPAAPVWSSSRKGKRRWAVGFYGSGSGKGSGRALVYCA